MCLLFHTAAVTDHLIGLCRPHIVVPPRGGREIPYAFIVLLIVDTFSLDHACMPLFVCVVCGY